MAISTQVWQPFIKLCQPCQPSISTQFVDLFVSEGLVKTHIKFHKVFMHITVRNAVRKKILPISGTLVTVCNPGLLNGDFSSDVFDLLQRSSGMPEIFLKIKYLFSINEENIKINYLVWILSLIVTQLSLWKPYCSERNPHCLGPRFYP